MLWRFVQNLHMTHVGLQVKYHLDRGCEGKVEEDTAKMKCYAKSVVDDSSLVYYFIDGYQSPVMVRRRVWDHAFIKIGVEN